MSNPTESPSAQVVPIDAAARKLTMLRPIAQPAELIQAQDEMRHYIERALKEGRDYAQIPGVEKPSLLQPGAERICAGYGVIPRYHIREAEIDHDREVPWRKTKAKWEFSPEAQKRVRVGEDVTEGFSLGLYRFVVECELVHRETGVVVGTAIASCSTLEARYVDRPRESENTVLQMAQKRAFVRATRTTFGLSEQFTQDVDENPDAYEGHPTAGSPGPARPPATATPSATSATSATSPTRPPAPSRVTGTGPTVPFGPSKGTPLAQAETNDLQGSLRWAEKNNPAKWAGFISAARAELARRKAEEAATGVPDEEREDEPPGDDDIPF